MDPVAIGVLIGVACLLTGLALEYLNRRRIERRRLSQPLIRK